MAGKSKDYCVLFAMVMNSGSRMWFGDHTACADAFREIHESILTNHTLGLTARFEKAGGPSHYNGLGFWHVDVSSRLFRFFLDTRNASVTFVEMMKQGTNGNKCLCGVH
jgi:hypothetical protein